MSLQSIQIDITAVLTAHIARSRTSRLQGETLAQTGNSKLGPVVDLRCNNRFTTSSLGLCCMHHLEAAHTGIDLDQGGYSCSQILRCKGSAQARRAPTDHIQQFQPAIAMSKPPEGSCETAKSLRRIVRKTKAIQGTMLCQTLVRHLCGKLLRLQTVERMLIAHSPSCLRTRVFGAV